MYKGEDNKKKIKILVWILSRSTDNVNMLASFVTITSSLHYNPIFIVKSKKHVSS